MVMQASDFIVQHEQFKSSVSYYHFMADVYAQNGHGLLVTPDGNSQGEVKARINQGRWIADCGDCNAAVIVTMASAYLQRGSPLPKPRISRWPPHTFTKGVRSQDREFQIGPRVPSHGVAG